MEVAYTFGGLAVLFYNLYFLLYGTVTGDEGMIALVIMGLFMVFGAVLALVSNSRAVVRGFGRALSFSPRAKAIAEPAIGHPLNKGFRTGMTISMFALVIFIVLLFSIFFTVFTPNLEDEGGGYHLAAYSSVPVMDIHNLSFAGNGSGGPTVDYTTLNTKVELIDSIAEHGFWGNFYLGETEVPTYGAPYHSLFGIDVNFSSHVEYELSDRSNNYTTDREAWLAVANDPSLAIVDMTTAGTHIPIMVGDVVSLPDGAGAAPNKTYTVVGIVDEILFLGMFVQKEGLFKDFPQVRGNNFFLISLKEGENHKTVAQQLEADFSLIGMNVIVLEEVLEAATKAIESIFQMFELFMSLGLVVGIASLGVLSVRAVIERKQEIGIMRAIGYRKSMVMGTFVLEMLFVTTMGVLIGVAIGWLGGYGIWKSGMEELGVEFAVPWGRIGLIILLTYIAAILCTILPAYKASRTRAAEAMREIE
jgi:putative ABC transport system permease protein